MPATGSSAATTRKRNRVRSASVPLATLAASTANPSPTASASSHDRRNDGVAASSLAACSGTRKASSARSTGPGRGASIETTTSCHMRSSDAAGTEAASPARQVSHASRCASSEDARTSSSAPVA
jgi:hypothetical protein